MVTMRAHDPWPGDVPLGDPAAAGLRHDCIVRLKLFTLDNRLILRRIGSLIPSDRAAVAREITSLLLPD
jgi:mRNA interferase MazF